MDMCHFNIHNVDITTHTQTTLSSSGTLINQLHDMNLMKYLWRHMILSLIAQKVFLTFIMTKPLLAYRRERVRK